MDAIKVIFTAILSVVALFVITKFMGHKQVAQLDFFDYVSGITIGSIGAELATELEAPERPLIALGIYGIASVILNLISHKIPKARKYINGAPTVLMNGGKLYRENMRKSKLDIPDFMMLCREKGYFDLEEIQTAVFEYNGKISILPKGGNRPATPSDLEIAVDETQTGVELIMDGSVMEENLSRIGRDRIWLKKQLKLHGYNDIKEILLAVYRTDVGRMTLYPNE